ncbi:MAG: hypothetical protein KatS3mg068_1011 [Candidatus Sericytochromatia bacterium]|nr:MAG: hypothetical protein KatS3mg068_1011 [Candidatus Sericytochromatia bacterium]
MNLSELIKTVKSEVSNFLHAKKMEKKNPPKKITNQIDKFVKSNGNDLMDVRVKTRYVNGICYGQNHI